MMAWSLRKTHNQTTLIVACHHRHWKTTMIRLCCVWHVINALGQHTRSDAIEHGMPSSPLDNTHGRTTSSEACRHLPWAAHTVKRRRAWHVVIALGQHARMDDVGHGMRSSPLDHTHDWTMFDMHAIIALGVHTQLAYVGGCMPACPLGRTRSEDVGRGKPSSPLNCMHS